MRILIVGGYGTFGARIVELLENESSLCLLVAGRSLAAAKRYCKSKRDASCLLEPLAFDRQTASVEALRGLGAHLVIDASGPFQAYGVERYRLIELCIAAGANYLDLADGADFVAGVAGHDGAAKRAGVFVLSGVSSFPVLTAAVVRRLAGDAMRPRAIRAGIAPSPFAGVGMNVIRAITGYAGQPTVLRRAGEWQRAYPFTESISRVVSVPGSMPLPSRRYSLVEVPDLKILAEAWPGVREVWVGAGPVPATLHGLLRGLAWLVRWRVLPSLSSLAPLIAWVSNHLRWGEHRGGMFVEVEGERADGAAVARRWHMLAEGPAGPLIPCMGIEAVVRRCLAGRRPPPGARAAMGDVDLSDYEALFAKRQIVTAIHEGGPEGALPLYARFFGARWSSLPSTLRAAHEVAPVLDLEGRCDVERGVNPLAWLVARLVGFPRPCRDELITVRMSTDGDGERWTRTVAGRTFSSHQTAGKGRSFGLVRERFGPLAADMALLLSPGERPGWALKLRRWSLCGVPMPLILGPRCDAAEYVEQGRFRFSVSLSHPLLGLIVRYRGWLEPRR